MVRFFYIFWLKPSGLLFFHSSFSLSILQYHLLHFRAVKIFNLLPDDVSLDFLFSFPMEIFNYVICDPLSLFIISFQTTKPELTPDIDYLHLTRRFGIVAASQLPLHYLLALKSWSPIQYLTRLSHEELNPYHRILGRILTGFFLAHGLLYLNFYVQLSILSKRLRSADVLLGLSALTTLLVLNSTALARVRTWSYRLFFGSHVMLSIIILPLLYFHVSHARLYVLEAAMIYIILIIQRSISSTSVLATITRLPGSPLLSIRIPLTPRLARRRYYPGQHIYLSLPATRVSPLNRLRHHPFTIAVLPAPVASEMQLVIRPIRGTTQLLSSLAQQAQTPPKSRLLIEGPYGASRCFSDLLRTHHRILLVAGGVGATFTLPIYYHLQQEKQQQPHMLPRTNQKVRFVWSVRSIADATWGLQQLQSQEDSDDSSNNGSSSYPPDQQDTALASHATSTSSHSCDIYISSSSSSSPSPPLFPPSPSTLELHPRPPATSIPSSSPSYQIHNGRPDLRLIVNEIFSEVDAEPEPDIEVDIASHIDDDDHNEDETEDQIDIPRLDSPHSIQHQPPSESKTQIAVLVCGPIGMGSALRTEVGRWVRRGRRKGQWDVFWHNEEFGW